ncbi:MAG: DUF1285 domain-containing protein [Myxococcales bacterium]|nr:DUF1285 domain-containing protein [Myxococcales bacterium]
MCWAMEPSDFLGGRTRETPIRRDAQGRWFHGDTPITHPKLVRAFDAWVDVAEDGRYCLRNDINWAYVAIEGPPLFVRSVAHDATGVRLILSDGTEEPLRGETLRQGKEGALYCTARGGRLAARFDRSAMARLEDLIGEDEGGLFVEVGPSRYYPPTFSDQAGKVEP